MISNQQTTPENSWISFPFGEISKEFSYGATVLIGHHLFVFAHGPEDSKRRVINLKDNSVQTCWGFSFGDVNDNYSLTKYGENQIIKFGGEVNRKASNELVLITISSFEPLIMRSEVIQNDDAPNFPDMQQLFIKTVYMFSVEETGEQINSQRRNFGAMISIGRWKLCETIGRGPKPREGAKSFIKNDNLYIYGGFTRNSKTRVNYSELFELNLNSMKWRKIEQKEPNPGQDSEFFGRFSADVYGDNLLILKNEAKDESDKLYYCNRRDLSCWSAIHAQEFEGMKTLGNSVIYENVLYVCATKNAEKNQLFLAALQLDDLPLLKSSEEIRFNSLFMNTRDSDVKFKVRDEIIPAHKKVFAQKSQYFADLFNNSPNQKIIEIDSRKENTFKKFLQYIYNGTIDADLAKFLLVSENYAQEENLHLKCVNILARSLTLDNICSTFDFACEHDITLLKDWCVKFFQCHMSFENIIKWNGYLKNPLKSHQWTDIAVDFLLRDLFKLMAGDREALRQYEDFMVKSVSIQNVVKLSEYYLHFQVKMPNLKEAMLNFVDTNLYSLQEQGLYKKFSFHFDLAFSAYQKKQKENSIPSREYSTDAESSSQLSRRDQKERKGLKRMEPSSYSCEEEQRHTNPILKKNKQSLVN